jgi:hypothetical protein
MERTALLSQEGSDIALQALYREGWFHCRYVSALQPPRRFAPPLLTPEGSPPFPYAGILLRTTSKNVVLTGVIFAAEDDRYFGQVFLSRRAVFATTAPAPRESKGPQSRRS